jgi:type IV pilus assembly protein PilV
MRTTMTQAGRARGATSRVAMRGVMLLEALIGILVFSCGVLGLVAMHAATIAQVTDARERTQASYFANQIIAQMWSDDHTILAQYDHFATAGATSCTFGGAATGNANAINWLTALRTSGTGLPGAVALDNHTQIAVATNTPAPGNTQVSVTICWKTPDETGWHKFTDIANINNS